MTKTARSLFYITAFFLLTVFISTWFSGSTTYKSNFNRPLKLKEIIEKSLKDTEGKYGIFIKNLKTEEIYKLAEDETFEAGSLYKLWLMGLIFEKVKQGDLKEDETIEISIEKINRIFDIDEPELTQGVLNFTVLSAIEQMITISHNYAALTLLSKTNQDTVDKFTKSLGLKHSTMKIPMQTTAEDIGLYLEKLYKGEVVDLEYSQKMIEILKRQKVNDRIPKLLPEGTSIAHKTADINYSEHDAGIIFIPKGDYVIVILSESKDPQFSGEKIAQISKAVYDYFIK